MSVETHNPKVAQAAPNAIASIILTTYIHVPFIFSARDAQTGDSQLMVSSVIG